MHVLETERLVLRQLDERDAAFILQLVNEPSWLQYIGDRGVRTLQDAERYIRDGPVAMYARLGFGLWLVALKETLEPIGICGLIKRDALPDVDLGFALLPRFWGKGYALESASATVAYGKARLGLSRVVAVTTKSNHASGRLLEKLGFRFERLVRLAEDGEELKLYAASP